MAIRKHVARPAPMATVAPLCAFLKAMRENGIPIEKILGSRGIAVFTDEDAFAVVSALSDAQRCDLVEACLSEIYWAGQSQGGVDVIVNEEYQLVCYAIIHCDTLRQAIERSVLFCRMVGRLGDPSFTIDGDQARFQLRRSYTFDTWPRFFLDLVGLYSWHRLFGWLIGQPILLSGVGVQHRAYLDEEIAYEIFGRGVTHHEPANYLAFPSAYLDCPIVRDYRELLVLLEKFPYDVSPPEYAKGAFSEQVRRVYQAAIASHRPMPNVDSMAASFGISAATFRRRLAEESVSADQLKEECRRARACEQLLRTARTVDEIAAELGFSSNKWFRSAFRNWTGMSPSEYRRSHERAAHRPPP